MASKNTDPRVTKRRVTMRSAALAPDGNVYTTEMTDYVRPDFLDAYLADARGRWQVVEVSDEPDAGPAGYEGATTVPAHLDHPLAGIEFPAETVETEGN
jgi:hypothetical protein